MLYRVIGLFAILLAAASCSPVSLDSTEGESWSEQLDNPIVCGIITNGSYLYFADSAGSVFCYDMSSGLLHSKFQLSNQTVEAMTVYGGYQYIITSNANDGSNYLYTYDNNGVQQSSQYFPFTPGNSVLDSSSGLFYAYNGLSFAVINLTSNPTYSTYAFGVTGSGNGVSSFVKGDSLNWYAVTTNCGVYVLNSPSFNNPAQKTVNGITGSYLLTCNAVYANSYLYLGTSAGVLIVSTSSFTSSSSGFSDPVSSTGMVYDAANSCLYIAYAQNATSHGIACQTINGSSLGNPWSENRSTTYDLANSSIFFSTTYNAVGFLDDSGYIDIYNRQTGAPAYQTTLYLGTENCTGLTAPMDSTGEYVYLPVNSPNPKLVCYSVEWAMQQASK
jgi:hypothetical protein